MTQEAAQALVENILSQPFDVGPYRTLVRNLLRERWIEEDLALPQARARYEEHVQEVRRLGSFRGADDDQLDVLAVQLDGAEQLDRARTRQRNLVADYLKDRDRDAALVAFWVDGSPSWRLSFVRVDYRTVLDEDGDVKVYEDITPPRRYSFIVGKDEPCHTAQKQLLGLLTREVAPTVENVERAFSVEAVTEDFYKVYARLFQQAEAAITGFDTTAKDATVRAREEEALRLFTQRLFNRLLFIRFLELVSNSVG